MVLGEVDAALSIWDRLQNWWDRRKSPPVESVATRFVRLFESHGVHRNQIPRFVGYGLTTRDVQDDTALLAKLDESLLAGACALFAVRREWLDGAESQVHPTYAFQKQPEEFAAFLDERYVDRTQGPSNGLLLAPIDSHAQASALLLLDERVGSVGDRPIHRFHIVDAGPFAYWKSRAYTTACVAIAWKRKVYIHGRFVPFTSIERLAQGQVLLGWRGECFTQLGGQRWHPEDMALRPDDFLKGVDPETDKFGTKSALELWLYLDKRGFMDIGLKNVIARPLFEAALAKHSLGLISL